MLNGGSKKELKNDRPVAIINVVRKLFMMVFGEIINGWVEESDMLGDIQAGFRKGRRTEDNFFYAREDDGDGQSKKVMFDGTFIGMEKAYDIVNSKKLFEFMR